MSDSPRWWIMYISKVATEPRLQVTGFAVSSFGSAIVQSRKREGCFPVYGARAEVLPFTFPENRALVDALCERWRPVLARARPYADQLDDTPVRNARVQWT